MIYLLLAALILVNLAWLYATDRTAKRHQASIDQLTNKIMASSLAEYRVATEPVKPQPPVISRSSSIPVADASPEEILHALAVEAGEVEA